MTSYKVREAASIVNDRTPEETVRGFFDTVNERRMDLLDDYMAADVVDHNKIIVGEEDRPGAAFDGFRQQTEAFDPARMEVIETVTQDDRVVARLLMTGVHSGYHPRMPEPTGRPFAVEAMFLCTVRDGRIAEIRAVSDRLGMFLQAGWDWPTAE
jgi:ketosteroid isomerase-like protein